MFTQEVGSDWPRCLRLAATLEQALSLRECRRPCRRLRAERGAAEAGFGITPADGARGSVESAASTPALKLPSVRIPL